MAGDWIKIETALPTKIEILQLTELLDCSRAEALGHCVVFWCWCDANMSPECRHVAATKKTLDDVIGATGFAQALVDVGWLHETRVDDRPALEVPNFDQHLSKSAKTRARKSKNKKSERSGDGKFVAKMSPRDGDKTATREEKRREENKEGLRPSRAAKFSPADRDVAEAIEHTLLRDQPDRKRANLGQWANAVRLMRERDGRTHEQILDLFAWANNDEFWRANILSPGKLRQKWDQLTAKRNATNAQQPTSTAQRRENANAAAFSALRFEDDPDVAETPERVTGDSGDAGAIVFNEESGAVYTARRGDLGGDSFELPY